MVRSGATSCVRVCSVLPGRVRLGCAWCLSFGFSLARSSAVAVTPDVRDAIAGWLGAVGTRQEDVAARRQEIGCAATDLIASLVGYLQSRVRDRCLPGVCGRGFAESGLRDQEAEASRYEHRTAWDTWDTRDTWACTAQKGEGSPRYRRRDAPVMRRAATASGRSYQNVPGGLVPVTVGVGAGGVVSVAGPSFGAGRGACAPSGWCLSWPQT